MIVFDYIWPDIGEKVDFMKLKDVLLFGFMALSTLVGYLMTNPVYKYINLRFQNEYLVDNIPNVPEPTCLHTNSSTYCYRTLTIQFNISILFVQS